jgi:hypothetical protein
MRASFRTRLAWAALASLTLVACNERQRDPNDPSSMAAGAPALRAVSNAPDPAASGLTDHMYVIQISDPATSDVDVDTITFADGRFRSKGCEQYGFADTDYRTIRDNVGEAFSATATSEKEGRMEWSGMLVKGRLDGTCTWTKPGQKPIEYRFKGIAEK